MSLSLEDILGDHIGHPLSPDLGNSLSAGASPLSQRPSSRQRRDDSAASYVPTPQRQNFNLRLSTPVPPIDGPQQTELSFSFAREPSLDAIFTPQVTAGTARPVGVRVPSEPRSAGSHARSTSARMLDRPVRIGEDGYRHPVSRQQTPARPVSPLHRSTHRHRDRSRSPARGERSPDHRSRRDRKERSRKKRRVPRAEDLRRLCQDDSRDPPPHQRHRSPVRAPVVASRAANAAGTVEYISLLSSPAGSPQRGPPLPFSTDLPSPLRRPAIPLFPNSQRGTTEPKDASKKHQDKSLRRPSSGYSVQDSDSDDDEVLPPMPVPRKPTIPRKRSDHSIMHQQRVPHATPQLESYRESYTRNVEVRYMYAAEPTTQRRSFWTKEEEAEFTRLFDKFPRRYSEISSYDRGRKGKGILTHRSQIQLKDKARIIAKLMIKSGQKLLPQWVGVIQKDSTLGKQLEAAGYTVPDQIH